MFSDTNRIYARMRSALFSALALFASSQVYSQETSGFYIERFERVRSITQLMVNDFANATLASACLTASNFERATASLDRASLAVATRLREEGIKTLHETKAWNTCKSQNEQANRFATEMSSAMARSAARADAKKFALLAADEEIKNGFLINSKTGTPVTSSSRSAFPVGLDTLLGSRDGVARPFDAILVISVEGIVTACNITSSTGNDIVDDNICRKAQLFLRYRPAFENGSIVPSTARLRVNVTD